LASVGSIVIVVTAFYGLMTLLYNAPSNPLRISFDAKLTTFEKWFFQKWSFFAPPPTENDRLYFAFSPISGEGVTIEVLQGVYARKQQDAPFNVRAEVVDYVISGNAAGIRDSIREVNRYAKVHEFFEGDPRFLNDVALAYLDPTNELEGSGIRVLLRFAAVLAEDHGLELEGLKCQIAFARIPLRPFTHRYNAEFPVEEELTYKTAILDVPRLSQP
jgi:hypothetical protein